VPGSRTGKAGCGSRWSVQYSQVSMAAHPTEGV
jgi:hypothetical protein